jgi:L-asparaginase
MAMKPIISVLLLGGTISMAPAKGSPENNKGVVPSVGADDLCNAVPGLADVARVVPQTVKMVASANLNLNDIFDLKNKIEELSREDNSGGVVIVQGTDTLEEVAFMLDLILDVNIPVAVTGAMRSANMVSADGPANILSATIAAGSSALSSAGVVVVMNEEIHAARFVQKCHTRDVGAFKSLNGGRLGQICEGSVLLAASITKKPTINISDIKDIPKVGLVKATLGDDGGMLEHVLSESYDGLVVEAFGAGHLPEAWLPLLDRLVDKMPVMLCSRTAEGPVFEKSYGYAGAEIDLIARGLIPAGILDGPKARLFMQACLLSGKAVTKPPY